MTKYNKEVSEIVGLDLGDRYCQLCVVNQQGEIVEQGRVSTTAAGMRKRFEGKGSVRIAPGAGTHSPWVSRLLEELGHQVLVANPRKLRMIYQSDSKNDRADAEALARVARMDARLLGAIRHRKQQPQLRITKAGDPLLRRLLVNSAQYLLGHFGQDCDLRRWGLELAKRGGKNAKKRAVVAVARKLAVLLHRLWSQGEGYDPFYQSQSQAVSISVS